MRLRPRRVRLPARLRLRRRSVRLRLTALYVALFLLCGAALLAVTISLDGAWSSTAEVSSPSSHAVAGTTITGPAAGQDVPRLLLQQMLARIGRLTGQASAQAAQIHGFERHELQTAAVIALCVMAGVSVVVGWLVAGRILRPLRAMTAATRQISEDDLHQRLAMPGPADELKDLADTIDGLLARLEAAFDAQRTFVANASHELRTPLTLTRTLLQMALTDPRPTLTSFRTTCEEVLAAEEHQEQLIEALLTLARSQRGLDRRELADLAAITRAVLDACEPDAARRGLVLIGSVAAAPVLGDACLLRRLVANLVENALRYNIPGGRVDIGVTGEGGRARLTITNTGRVVPADLAGRLLQPFQRLSASRPADEEGLGLGLSVVTAIARAHDAMLAVSPGSGGGLRVEITFPAVMAGAATAAGPGALAAI